VADQVDNRQYGRTGYEGSFQNLHPGWLLGVGKALFPPLITPARTMSVTVIDIESEKRFECLHSLAQSGLELLQSLEDITRGNKVKTNESVCARVFTIDIESDAPVRWNSNVGFVAFLRSGFSNPSLRANLPVFLQCGRIRIVLDRIIRHTGPLLGSESACSASSLWTVPMTVWHL